jgi:hypothetical protein
VLMRSAPANAKHIPDLRSVIQISLADEPFRHLRQLRARKKSDATYYQRLNPRVYPTVIRENCLMQSADVRLDC